tara:strand:- start:106 stop:252 length:147 start_codon:yes stop_codon:yes gene_type:complete
MSINVNTRVCDQKLLPTKIKTFAIKYLFILRGQIIQIYIQEKKQNIYF